MSCQEEGIFLCVWEECSINITCFHFSKKNCQLAVAFLCLVFIWRTCLLVKVILNTPIIRAHGCGRGRGSCSRGGNPDIGSQVREREEGLEASYLVPS